MSKIYSLNKFERKHPDCLDENLNPLMDQGYVNCSLVRLLLASNLTKYKKIRANKTLKILILDLDLVDDSLFTSTC